MLYSEALRCAFPVSAAAFELARTAKAGKTVQHIRNGEKRGGQFARDPGAQRVSVYTYTGNPLEAGKLGRPTEASAQAGEITARLFA